MNDHFDEGIAHFRAGRYFEAHEALEAAWRPMPRGPDRDVIQGLIQLAVSLEHWRRGNRRGADGQWEKALQKLGDRPAFLGLDLADLLAQFRRFRAAEGEAPWPQPAAISGGESGR